MAAAAGTDEEGLTIISEKQSTTTKPEQESPAGAICAALVVLVLLILGVVYLSIGVVHFFSHWQRFFGPYDPVAYTDLHGPPALLYPAFNLTLRVASPRTAEDRECVKPGTTVEVSYPRSAGVPLATGTAPTFCVDVGERREEGSVIAWGDGVRLPGLVLDSLAADGAPEFGVKLTPLPDCRSGWRFCSDTVDVISCWAKVGGGPAPCSVLKERVSLPPVPRASVRDSAANLPQPAP
ncbi:unnamed protein product [Miscanthus lutarioriparius]|uniref:Uncharacterized protein n=1 Tax=Miscanthus lutarioriparius TaxID=422564 RepID=A0A811QYJ5_9POAL|nr:unnamed protein product [Miscanthus lutarioriparius]